MIKRTLFCNERCQKLGARFRVCCIKDEGFDGRMACLEEEFSGVGLGGGGGGGEWFCVVQAR